MLMMVTEAAEYTLLAGRRYAEQGSASARSATGSRAVEQTSHVKEPAVGIPTVVGSARKAIQDLLLTRSLSSNRKMWTVFGSALVVS